MIRINVKKEAPCHLELEAQSSNKKIKTTESETIKSKSHEVPKQEELMIKLAASSSMTRKMDCHPNTEERYPMLDINRQTLPVSFSLPSANIDPLMGLSHPSILLQKQLQQLQRASISNPYFQSPQNFVQVQNQVVSQHLPPNSYPVTIHPGTNFPRNWERSHGIQRLRNKIMTDGLINGAGVLNNNTCLPFPWGSNFY